MKFTLKTIVIVLFLVLLSSYHAMGQQWEKATKPQIELVKNLHQWLKVGDSNGMLGRYLQSTELAKLVKEQGNNINPDLLMFVLNAGGKLPVEKGDETINNIICGGAKMIDWSRVYLKYVWRQSVINTAALDLDIVLIQFSRGAAKVWLQIGVVHVDGSLHLCLMNEWKITRDGVINLPIPDSTKDTSKYGALRRAMELMIDLARFPQPISSVDDEVPARAKDAVATFERAKSGEDLGRHVFNCCVTKDFNALRKVLVPAKKNSDTEGLSAGQFEVLAALDLEKLYANSMVYWGFNWQDCVLKSVTQKDRTITVVFNTIIQLKDGKARPAELEFAIYGSKEIDDVWYLSTNPEYPTGISVVTMQGVTIDVSGLVEVSGRLTLDGKPLSNAVISMTPWSPITRNNNAERGLNSRIPSGRTNAKGEFTMTVIYNSDSGTPVVFEKIATNKYIVGVFDGAPMDSGDSTRELPEAEPVNPKLDAELKNARSNRVPQVFANPFALKGNGKFLAVTKSLTAVCIKLTSDGKMEVLPSMR